MTITIKYEGVFLWRQRNRQRRVRVAVPDGDGKMNCDENGNRDFGHESCRPHSRHD
jgi:hypothetical protein